MNLDEVKLEFYMKSEEFDTPYIGINGFPVEKNEEYLIILNDGTTKFVKINHEGFLYSPDMKIDLTEIIKCCGIYKTYEIY